MSYSWLHFRCWQEHAKDYLSVQRKLLHGRVPMLQSMHAGLLKEQINNDEDTSSVSCKVATLFSNNSMQHLNLLKKNFHELPFMHPTLYTKNMVVFLCPQTVTHQWFIQFIACSISTMHCVLSKDDFVQFFCTSFLSDLRGSWKNSSPDQKLCCREAFDF